MFVHGIWVLGIELYNLFSFWGLASKVVFFEMLIFRFWALEINFELFFQKFVSREGYKGKDYFLVALFLGLCFYRLFFVVFQKVEFYGYFVGIIF